MPELPSEKERDWLREKLHSPEMQCRQCEITKRLLDATAQKES